MEVPLVGLDGGLQKVVELVVVGVVAPAADALSGVVMAVAAVVQVAEFFEVSFEEAEARDVLALVAALQVLDEFKGVVFCVFGLDCVQSRECDY